MSQESPLTVMSQYLKAREENLATIAPKGADVKRMTNLALAAFSNDPNLWACSPESVYLALHRATTFGLELTGTGIYAQAFLVPRPNHKKNTVEAVFQIGYKGLRDLVMRSGLVRSLIARPVYDCDRFEIVFGDNESLIHIPDMGHANQGDDAHLIGVYAIAKLDHGDPIREYWPRQRLERHRDKFAATRDRKTNKVTYGPWHDNFGAMCLKTMVIQVCRWLPIDATAAAALDAARDDHDEEEPKPVAGVVVPPATATATADPVAPKAALTAPAPTPTSVTGASVKERVRAARTRKPAAAPAPVAAAPAAPAMKDAQGDVIPELEDQEPEAPTPPVEEVDEPGANDGEVADLGVLVKLRETVNHPRVTKAAALEAARAALEEVDSETSRQILRGHQFASLSEFLEKGIARTAQRVVDEVCAELGVR